MAYQITDRNGKVHTSKAKTVKTAAQLVYFADGRVQAYWFKSLLAAQEDAAKTQRPGLEITVHAI